MIFRYSRSFLIFFIFFAATAYSFLVLNRWVLTDLGLLSYGRVWQLYISWFDFGFFRRGLVGTLFSETGIHTAFKNEYIFAIVLQHIAILALVTLLYVYCLRKGIKNILFLIGLVFSPALIAQSGYATGTLDIFVLLVALINILFVRNVFVFCLYLVLGTLIHELFVFTIPAQLYVFHFKGPYKKGFDSIFVNALPTFVSIAVLILVSQFGKIEVLEETYNAIMQQKIPNSYGHNPIWSGYWEVSSNVATNLIYRATHYPFSAVTVLFLIPGILYILFLTARGVKLTSGRLESLILAISVLFPLLAAVVAADFFRWIGMSANMALLVTLRLMQDDGSKTEKWNAILCGFCLLAPFGVAHYRPFPIHQFVIEKLL